MRRVLKLTRNGNATTICIPRCVLSQLRWHAGDQMVMEVTDIDRVSVRPARAADLRTPGLVLVDAETLQGLAK
jgi:antitoxin component of MazEF toxin-antitoxin module